MNSKPSNPKDIVGSTKLPLELVPDVPEEALPFLEGALKYGRFNWRIAGVRSSIYYAAMRRHQKKWWNGIDADPKTRVHHLLSVIACCKIILDAERCGKLEDDRPPRVDLEPGIEAAEEIARHLRDMFAEHKPKQYTIADSEVPAAEPSPQRELPLHKPSVDVLTAEAGLSLLGRCREIERRGHRAEYQKLVDGLDRVKDYGP